MRALHELRTGWPSAVITGLLVTDLVADPSIHQHVAVLAVISVLVCVAVVRAKWSTPVLAVCIGVLLVVAVAERPVGTDLWSYQAYGRILSVQHHNPYVAVPADFPDDPVMGRVSDLYQDVPSAYGPVFTGGAAAVAAATGTSEPAGRLAWQIIGGAGLLLALWLLRRRGVGTDAIAVIALSPVAVEELVHLAHNDVLVGVAILGGCLLAARDRFVPAAVLLAVAALVKAPSALALVVLVLWLAASGRRREAIRSAGAAALLAVATLTPFGIVTAVRAMLETSPRLNATSIWNLAAGHWEMFVHRPLVSGDRTAGPVVVTASVLAPLAVAGWAAYRMRGRPLHEPVTVALLGWMVFSLAPASWYVGWMLPLVALWSLRERLLLAGFTCLVLVTSQAWLMPVAALITAGHLAPLDRLPALLLGVSTVAGIALLADLSGARRVSVIRIPAAAAEPPPR